MPSIGLKYGMYMCLINHPSFSLMEHGYKGQLSSDFNILHSSLELEIPSHSSGDPCLIMKLG